MWLTIYVISILPALSFNGKLTLELKSQLNAINQGEKILAIIHMREQYPYEEVENLSIHERAQVFKDIAKASQQPLIDYLKQFPEKVDSIRQFWVFNGFHIKATKDIIEEIAKRDDIWFISHNAKVELPPTERGEEIPSRAIEWNIQKVMADSCWNAGYTGTGIFIGHIDTGVNFNHPALQGKWSGKWRDYINGQPNPYDDNGHGSHTAGIICGGDGLGPFTNDIGVAPSVRIIAAKVFSSYETPIEIILAAMEWMAALKADSGYNIRAVSNSWGGPGVSLYFWNVCNTWKSLQIFPVFAIGNMGPGSGTTCPPGNYPLVIAGGATNLNDSIANFSSRGPAPNQSPWNDIINWYRIDWNLIKPDISAPGVSVRSAYYNNNYYVMTGTSMSAPHIAGATAVLCQANPNLTVREIYNILLNNADHPSQGAPYPNNNYGWGRLNIWKSLQSVVGVAEQEKICPFINFVSIAPNPTKGDIKIGFNSNNNFQINIKLYDASGRLLHQKDLLPRKQGSRYLLEHLKGDMNEFSISLNNLPAGIYFVKLETQHINIIKKVIRVN